MKPCDSPHKIWHRKMAQPHSPDEVAREFMSSRSICFNYDRGYMSARNQLFASIWQIAPNAVLTRVTLCIEENGKLIAFPDQLLLLDSGGDDRRILAISSLMTESGIISYQLGFVQGAEGSFIGRQDLPFSCGGSPISGRVTVNDGGVVVCVEGEHKI